MTLDDIFESDGRLPDPSPDETLRELEARRQRAEARQDVDYDLEVPEFDEYDPLMDPDFNERE